MRSCPMGVKERWKRTAPISIPTAEAVEAIIKVLRADERIKIAYLFGSRNRETHSPSSDLDIGFYTEGDYSWDDFISINGALTGILHSDRLDLVWLNAADPVISFEVICSGRVLFYAGADVLNDFELKSRKRFYDYSLYLTRHRKVTANGV